MHRPQSSTPAPAEATAPAAAAPPAWLVGLLSVTLVLFMAVLRLRLLGDTIIPIGYGLPVVLFLWLRDRRFLWATAAGLAVVSVIKFTLVLPDDAAPNLSRPLGLALLLADLAVITTIVHVLIGTRLKLERHNARLAATVDDLTAKEEEIARQTEELQSQTEELERQSEELRVANDDLAAREKTLEHLLALSRSLISDLSREQVLQHVCEALGYLMGARAAASAIVERTDHHVTVSCHHGFGPDGLVAADIPLDQAFSAVVLNRARTAYIEDLALRPDLRVPQPKAGEPMRSVLAAPLRVHGRAFGTLEVYSRQPGGWTDEHVALLESLAAQASISLEAANLFDDVDRERRRFEAVFRTLPIGVAVANADHTEVRINPAAALLFGAAADGDHRPTPAEGGAHGAWALHRDGRPLARDEYPLRRAVTLGHETVGQEYELVIPSAGRRVTVLASASPIRDKSGRILGGVAAFTDITDRKALERELDQRRREAEESAVRKTRFLAAVSHDIRTPANAINLMAELIRRTAANPAMAPEVPSLASELQASASSLVSLVSDVLDLTRFDSGRIDLHETVFPLADAVAEEVRQQLPVAQAKGVALRYEPPPGPVTLRADRVKLGRVLGNLIGNAIKFTPRGEVVVSVLLGSDGQARVHVVDTGVGIDPEHLPRIFDEFFQLRNPERDATKGTGLGLTICKRLADAMGGQLLVESAPGQGSTFTLVLPASALTAANATDATTPPVTTPRPGLDGDAASPVAGLTGIRILLVEDDPITRAATRKLLQSEGAHVREAADVAAALTQLRHHPDTQVLLLDLMLPDGNGADVLTAMRDQPAARPPALHTTLVLTGDVADTTLDDLLPLGAHGVIPKPLEIESVVSAIRAHHPR